MDAKNGIFIGLVVVLLASSFFTYMSTKTWRATQVVLVFLVVVMSAVFWYFAAATLKTHQKYRYDIARLEADIAMAEKVNDALRNGTQDDQVQAQLQGLDVSEGGIRQVRLDLSKIMMGRGRVWYDTQPQQPGEDGTTTITIETPDPHNISAGTVLYAFEHMYDPTEGEGGKYLGEFKVTDAGEGSITVAPTLKIMPRQLERMQRSTMPWALYEVMPIDRHDLFVELDRDELAALLPAESVDEYAKDGKPAEPDAPPDRTWGYKADGTPATEAQADQVTEQRYVRRLRDYEYLFTELYAQQYVDFDEMEQLKRDTVLIQDALEKAKATVAYREQEKGKLAQDLQRFKQEVQVVGQQVAAVEMQLQNLRNILREVFLENRQLAARLAKLQLDAAEAIRSRDSVAETSAALTGVISR